MEPKVFSAELASLYEMLSFIKAFGVSQGITSSTVGEMILAVEEALVNIINYAYPAEVKGIIEITCQTVNNPLGINVTIKDYGVPFNPIENVPPKLPPAKRLLEKTEDSLGGYGIYLLTILMDEIAYQRVEEKNVLSLTKYFFNSIATT